MDAAKTNHSNIQGDLYSRGFPKDYETYYFFSIKDQKAKEFAQKLPALAKEISTLVTVREDREAIAATKLDASNEVGEPPRHDTVNALVAFSKTGLDKIQKGLPDSKLNLKMLRESDPIFARGMADDYGLCDPSPETWDPLFRTPASIDGVFKIAGSSIKLIDEKLTTIKKVLDHPTVIEDLAGASPPTTVNSRIDGYVRSAVPRGQEHFGYQDGISQPLMEGMDSEKIINKNQAMKTPQNVIIVSKDYPSVRSGMEVPPKPDKRPIWMYDGSFMVFRKLQQDVKLFEALTQRYGETHCVDKEHLAAHLMGRWRSGAPIHYFPDKDPCPGLAYHKQPQYGRGDLKWDNNWTHANEVRICPLAAHTRKTNPRSGGGLSNIVRSGIPYGSDYNPNDQADKGERGLLFVCYQSSIENGFRFVQQAWSNNPKFPGVAKDWQPGHDPIIGQDDERECVLRDAGEKVISELKKMSQPVTMKGGEYFFVPSITALTSGFKQGLPVEE